MIDVLLPHEGFLDYVIDFYNNNGAEHIEDFFKSYEGDPLFFTRHLRFPDGTYGYVSYVFDLLEEDDEWPCLFILALGSFTTVEPICSNFLDLIEALKEEYSIERVCAKYDMCKHFDIDASSGLSCGEFIIF